MVRKQFSNNRFSGLCMILITVIVYGVSSFKAILMFDAVAAYSRSKTNG